MPSKTFRQKSNIMMPSQELTTHSNRTDTFQRAQTAPVKESSLSSVLNVLNDVLPETANAVTGEIGIALEEDKVKQEQEAYLNAEPTEDATVYGKSAHHAVVARNETNVTRRELEGQAMTFEGTDKEWKDIEQQAFKDLLERTGGSRADMAVTGQMFREQMGKTADIRYSEKQRQDQQQKYNDFHASVLEGALATEEPGESEAFEGNMNIAFSEATEMGLSSDLQMKAFLDSAVSLANDQDDDRLIQYAKEIGVYGRNPALQEAQRSLTGRLLAQRNGDIALSAFNLEEEAYMGAYKDFEAFNNVASLAETEEGVRMHSASKLQSMWASAERRRNSDHQTQLVADNMLDLGIGDIADRAEARYRDGTMDPVIFLNMDTPTTKAVIEELDRRWAKGLNGALEGVEAGEEYQSILRDHRQKRSALLATNQLVDDNLKSMFTSLEGYEIEGVDGVELSPQMYVALSTLSDLEDTPSGLRTHASAKAIAISDFYKKAKARGMNDVQAFSEAKRLATAKPMRVSGAVEGRKFDRLVKSSINKDLSHSMFKFWKPSSISDAQKNHLAKDIRDYALELGGLNGGDMERSVELASKAILHNHTQLDNGDLVFGKPEWLGRQMGVPSNEAMDKLNNLAELVSLASEEDGLGQLNIDTDIPYNEWIPKISSNGTIRFLDPEGSSITSPLLLSTVGGFTLKQKIDHIVKREENLKKSRERQAERQKVSRYREEGLSKLTPEQRRYKYL